MDHEYLSPEVGARVVADARTINQALGYEMNTIEFAIGQGVPYAIDFLNPAPDFERDRITQFYFDIVVQKMADLVIDRALHPKPTNPWPRWEEMTGLGAPRGFIPAPPASRPRGCDLGALTPTAAWHALLRPEVEQAPEFWDEFSGRMRAARLTFGDRVHCPFLRPLFLDPADVARVSRVAETIAPVGERVVAAARTNPALLDAVGLTEAERALVAIEPGYERASTASRLDGFLLDDSLGFAEYNAESPAGLGYTEVLAKLFDEMPVMARFKQAYTASYFPLMSRILEALLASYREWGGTASPPTVLIVDFHGVPTWAEFEFLAAHFTALGVPTVVADPRDLTFEHGGLYAQGRRIDLRLPPRAHQRHPRAARRLRGARRRLPHAGGVRRQHVPLQDPAQEGVLRRAHRRGARRAVHAAGARGVPGAHPVDPPAGRREDDGGRSLRRPARARARRARAARDQAERRVRRGGRGARLGS